MIKYAEFYKPWNVSYKINKKHVFVYIYITTVVNK